MSSVRAVDCHAHVLRRDVPLTAERHSAPKYDATVEQYLAMLDEHGVSHGVLTAPSFYGTNNSLLLHALTSAKGRLRGTAIVDPTISDEDLRELAAGGVVGIRLNWIKRAALPDHTAPAYVRLFARIRDLGWHIEVYLEGEKLAEVLPGLRGHGAPVVVDHFGSPSPDKGVRCAGFREVLRGMTAGDTYVKLSAPYRLRGADARPYVDALLAAANGMNLVWATDWPFVGFEESNNYAQCVAWRDQWIADPGLRRLILAMTPARLFGFAEDQD